MNELKGKKLLFTGLHRPNRSPSQRYRIEQFLPFLKETEFQYDYSFLLNERRDKIFYSPGNFLGKIGILVYSVLYRLKELIFDIQKYDYVFVQREAFMLGTSFFEKQYAKKSKLIFDFDDAIWLLDVSQANKKWAFLKNPNKTNDILKASFKVVVGNQYLFDYAKQFNDNVVLIPTCVDTDFYKRKAELNQKPNGKVCIGWSGSQTTIEHFKLLEPVLNKLKEKYKDKIYFKVIGTNLYENKELQIKGVAWQKETEITELEEIDIGVMPLPNDKWAEGKCGLKSLVYMSMEIPAVIEQVGVNKQIVSDGANGYLASDQNSWIDKISKLIENFELRKDLGKKGRDCVLEKFSVSSQSEKFIELFN